MKTFKQFITERERSDDEALKLADYIVKRNKLKDRINLKYSVKDELKKVGKAYTSPAFIRSALTGKKPEPQEIELSKIRPGQAQVFHTRAGTKKKFNDDKPISVFKDKNGEFINVDGNQRAFAKRLKGKKTIKAHVY